MRCLALLAVCPLWVAPRQAPVFPLEPDGDSGSPSISDDGRYVTFESRASNFVAGDQKDSWDVFLLDRESGEVTRLSGEEPSAARSPVISGDGRWVAFLQAEGSREVLVTGNFSMTSEHPWKLALCDCRDGSLRWIGEGLPTQERTRAPEAASITRDGKRLVFGGVRGGVRVIQQYDAAAQRLSLVDVWKDGEPPSIDVDAPSISRNGRYLVFTTDATNLAPVPALRPGLLTFNFDNDDHVFRREVETGHTEYVSHLGIQAIGYAEFSRPRISDDGRFVAYDHDDPRRMLCTHVGFVSDLEQREPGRLLPVGEAADWWQGRVSVSWFSSDGRSALLDVYTELVPVVPRGCRTPQVVLRDLRNDGWALVSRSPEGAGGNLPSGGGAAAEDLSIIAFASEATNLVPGDTNSRADVFLFEPSTQRTTRVVPRRALPASSGRPSPATEPGGDSTGAEISEEGEHVVFASQASNYDEEDSGDSWDVFLLTCATGRVRRLSLEQHEMVSYPAISGDGRWIAYWLLPRRAAKADAPWCLKLHDRVAGTTKSIAGFELVYYGALVAAPSISRDGSRLVFDAPEPLHADKTGTIVTKLYDRALDAVSIVSRDHAGGINEEPAFSARISGDGSKVAFWCQSTSLAPWPIATRHNRFPTTSDGNVFLRDLEQQSTIAVYDRLAGAGFSGSCSDPRLSEDGRRVAFDHFDSTSWGRWGVGFVVDLGDEATGRLLPRATGAPGSQGTIDITWLAPDGGTVLVAARGEAWLEQPAAHPQIFLHALDGAEWAPISLNAAGQFANRPADLAVASRDLSRIVFESEADNLVPGDTNNARDLFIVDRKAKSIVRIVPR